MHFGRLLVDVLTQDVVFTGRALPWSDLLGFQMAKGANPHVPALSLGAVTHVNLGDEFGQANLFAALRGHVSKFTFQVHLGLGTWEYLPGRI